MAVVESADAINEAVEGIGFDDHCNSRLIRSAVERECITIGDALVWGVIQKSLSPLRATCAALIDSLQREES